MESRPDVAATFRLQFLVHSGNYARLATSDVESRFRPSFRFRVDIFPGEPDPHAGAPCLASCFSPTFKVSARLRGSCVSLLLFAVFCCRFLFLFFWRTNAPSPLPNTHHTGDIKSHVYQTKTVKKHKLEV